MEFVKELARAFGLAIIVITLLISIYGIAKGSSNRGTHLRCTDREGERRVVVSDFVRRYYLNTGYVSWTNHKGDSGKYISQTLICEVEHRPGRGHD